MKYLSFILGFVFISLGCKNICKPIFFKDVKLLASSQKKAFIHLKEVGNYNNKCGFYANIAGITPIEELDKEHQKYPYLGGKNGFLFEASKKVFFIHTKTQKTWLLFDFNLKQGEKRLIKDPFSKGYFMPIDADSVYSLYCRSIKYDSNWDDSIYNFVFINYLSPTPINVSFYVSYKKGIIGDYTFSEYNNCEYYYEKYGEILEDSIDLKEYDGSFYLD